MSSYNLSNIPGFIDFIKTGEINEYNMYYSVHEYSTKANEKYSIVRYNKEYLTTDLISTYGLLRSVILSGPRIVSFAPPKTISAARGTSAKCLKPVLATPPPPVYFAHLQAEKTSNQKLK